MSTLSRKPDSGCKQGHARESRPRGALSNGLLQAHRAGGTEGKEGGKTPRPSLSPPLPPAVLPACRTEPTVWAPAYAMGSSGIGGRRPRGQANLHPTPGDRGGAEGKLSSLTLRLDQTPGELVNLDASRGPAPDAQPAHSAAPPGFWVVGEGKCSRAVPVPVPVLRRMRPSSCLSTRTGLLPSPPLPSPRATNSAILEAGLNGLVLCGTPRQVKQLRRAPGFEPRIQRAAPGGEACGPSHTRRRDGRKGGGKEEVR